MINKIMLKCIPSPIPEINYKYYNTIKDIPKKQWSTLTKDESLFFSIPYLQSIENTLSENIEFQYILFYKKNTLLAIAITQLISFNSTQLKNQTFPCSINESIANNLINHLDTSILVCGNLFACGEYGFTYNKSMITSEEAFKVLFNALDAAKEKNTTKKPSFILLKDFWPKKSTIQNTVFKSHNFKELNIDVNMVLKLKTHWNSFDDYLEDMRTKFRNRAKSTFKKSALLTIKNFDAETIESYRDNIEKLYLSVVEKSNFNIERQSVNTFISIKKELKSSYFFYGYLLEDKLVGFSTSFLINNKLEANHVGINYELNKTYAIYQRILYDYVDLAIINKVEELHLGRTAETIKSSVGAQPVAMLLYTKHKNKISNKLIKPIIERIAPSKYEIRNPFKF